MMVASWLTSMGLWLLPLFLPHTSLYAHTHMHPPPTHTYTQFQPSFILSLALSVSVSVCLACRSSCVSCWHNIKVFMLCFPPCSMYVGVTFLVTAGFQDSDFCQKPIKLVLRRILSVIVTFQVSNFNPVTPMPLGPHVLLSALWQLKVILFCFLPYVM